MKKILLAMLAATSVMSASAQLGKAASEAADTAQHKIEQKRAEGKAEKSGPVGKVVNKAKSGYHEKQSQRSAGKAKRALKDAV